MVGDAQPYLRALRSGALGEDMRHPRQHVIRGVRLGDALGKLGQHLIWRRPLAVDQPVGDLLDALTHRLERNRDNPDGRSHLCAPPPGSSYADDTVFCFSLGGGT